MKNVPQCSSDPSLCAQPMLVLGKRLDECWEEYCARLKHTKRKFTNKNVHDLRVSIRSLLAVIAIVRAVVHGKRLKKSRRLLKSQLDAFDALRDTQVQITIVDEHQQRIPDLIAYLDHLHKREKILVAKLKKKIRAFRTAGLARQVARLRTMLPANEPPADESAILAITDEAYAVVMQRYAAVRADHSRSFHRLRLTFKKFRYMVESIYPLLPDPPDDLQRQLHDYQAALGNIQDAVVGAQMLAEFAEKSRAEFPAATVVFDEMQRERIQAFVEQMAMVKTFWRVAPDKKFPWQRSKRRKKPEKAEIS